MANIGRNKINMVNDLITPHDMYSPFLLQYRDVRNIKKSAESFPSHITDQGYAPL